MTEDQVRAILWDWDENEYEMKEENKNPFIVAILNNGDRIKGYFDFLCMSLGMLRMCNSFDAGNNEVKWFLIPIEEIRYIESTVALPYTGSFLYSEGSDKKNPESL